MRRELVRRVAAMAAFAALAGCGGGAPRTQPVLIIGDSLSTETVAFADGAGLRLPRHLDGFDRTQAPTLTSAGKMPVMVTAAYAGTTPSGPLGITIRVRKVGGGRTLLSAPETVASAKRSSAALASALASAGAASPGAVTGAGTPGAETNVFVVRFGAIQAGRGVTFDDAGSPVTLDAFCCVNGAWSYEFTFRGVPGEAGERFLRDLPWSASESASIEEAR